MSTGEKYPGFPDSIRQSTTNPIQMDRVKDMGNLATEFPAAPLQRTKLTYAMAWWALIALVLGIIPSIADFLLPAPWAIDIWGLFAVIAFSAIYLFYVGIPKSILTAGFLTITFPVFAVSMIYYRSTFALLLLASIATAMFADAYAKQILYLGTTSPFSRARAKFIRTKWRTRLLSFNTVRGLEFYGIGLALLLFTPWIIRALEPEIPTGGLFSRLPAVATTIGLIFCMPVIVEITAALFFARRTLGIRAAGLGFKRSLRDWFAYNFYNTRSPGLFFSPVGSSLFRRIAAVAVFCLWIAALNPLFSYKLGIGESIRHGRLVQIAESEKAKREAEKKAEADFLEHVRIGPKRSGYFPVETETAKPPSIEAPQPPPSRLNQLEPFQERMLERMSPEDRESYIRELISSPTTSPISPANPTQQQPKTSLLQQGTEAAIYNITNPHATDIYSEGENTPIVLLFGAVGLTFVVPKLIVIGFAILFPLAFVYANSVRIASSLREQLETNPDSILSLGNWEHLTNEVATSTDRDRKGQHTARCKRTR